MPCGGRRSSSSSPSPRVPRSPPRPRVAGAARCGSRRRQLGLRPSRNATQSAATGHSRHARLRTRAYGRAEIHDRLRVVARRAPRGVQASASDHSRRSTRGSPGIALDAELAREHALHVAVEDRVPLVARQRQDRAGRRAPDARQRHDRCRASPGIAAVPRDDHLRGALQVARARVVAEPGPQVQHLVDRRCGERSRRPGNAPMNASKYGIDRRDLRLLQHDLGDPHAVRRRDRAARAGPCGRRARTTRAAAQRTPPPVTRRSAPGSAFTRLVSRRSRTASSVEFLRARTA